ncbi:MAG: AMP-binding protein [Eggerthella lenta]
MAIQLYNSPEYVSATFALAKIGAVAVPINMQLVFGECAFQFDRCAIRTVICEPIARATISPTPCPVPEQHLWERGASILWSACSSATAVGRARRRCRGLRRRGRCVR